MPNRTQAQTPAYLWAQPFLRSTSGQAAGGVVGGKVAVDPAGNTYLVGSFSGVARFGAFSLTSAGATDVFVAKLDGSGNYLWVSSGGGSSEEQGVNITLDPAGNVYVVGSFRSQPATFGSASISTGNGDKDMFVAKLTAQGNWEWAVRAGGTGDEIGQGVACDGTHVFLAGYSNSDRPVFGPTTLLNASPPSGFVVAAQLSAATGAWTWATGSSGPGGGQASGGQATAIACDGSGGAYVTGSYGILATFGSTTLRSGDFNDIFVARLSPAGNWQWAVRADGTDEDRGLAIAVDGAGNPYITGYFLSPVLTLGSVTLTNASRNGDLFVARLTATGAFDWATRAGGTGGDSGQGLVVDRAGTAYVAGVFGPGPAAFGPVTVTPVGGQDTFVAAISATGTWQWALAGGSPSDETCPGVGVDAFGNVSFAGTFASPVSPARFGPFTIAGNPGSTTGFVARVGLPQTVRITGDSLLCNAGQVQLQAVTSVAPTAYRWNTGATTATIIVSQPGTYSVQVTFPGGQTSTATFHVASLNPAVQILGDTLLCPGQPLQLTATAPGALDYRWNTGATTPTLSVSQPGLYTVTARFSSGCSATASRLVRSPGLQITGGGPWCPASPPTLTAIAPGATRLRWNTGATTATLLVPGPGTYTLTATYANGCQLTVSEAVAVPTTVIVGDSVLCTGTGVRLTANLPAATAYRWNNGATTASITVTQPGLYRVSASYGNGCTSEAQWLVRAAEAVPVFSLGQDTTLCEGESLVLYAPTLPGTVRQWSDGSTGATLSVQSPGTYSLQLRSACGQRTVSRQITYRSCLFIPNVITPNGDALNEQFVAKGLPTGIWQLRIYSRWGVLVFESADYQHDWGQNAVAGTYYYVFHQAGSPLSYKGWLQVIR
ncbi:T9SS type B sorting domain-containing protein [Hymenobacter terrestris]|uniref:Gliding motility-associated C-terminal domain-containing protein n=1 Tax=Hymenobacter terrestris TaxID=2748310 RepID=A0ABX2Q4F0_9BACT|nr:gliding motility-associated C-terminal domain-containing protein [Hymenobacter terrestris]NVO85419.1 gliding motility-associated C-terminal domain-containing protein [Hymenobacter terrestris]